MMKIGVTGGIGSGKSTVCRLFAQKGVAVYDSDAAAKRLMQQDDALRVRLTERFGAGTNLFGYRVYMNKTLRIPLSELKYKRSREEGHEGKVVIDPQSLQSAISVRYSDIKVVSIGAVPELDYPEQKP